MIYYLISIVGMVVLSVVVDILLPSGRVGGFVKSICSLFLFFVIVSPIINYFNNSTNAISQFSENTLNEFSLNVCSDGIASLKTNIKKAIELGYGINVDVEIEYEDENGVANISRIFLYLGNGHKELNSNDIEAIINRVQMLCGAGAEVVVCE